ncbi:MAG TPA: CAP domain-containing protein [Noviherbaspirillum sp.]|nr:CAP domain-containing protein [Noviherbaspirillum sp.]
MRKALPRFFISSLLILGLSSCGGGSDSRVEVLGTAVQQDATADEGLARFNALRASLGLPQLARVSLLDHAAQTHSDYQARNNTITHHQEAGKLGYQPGWENLQGRITGSGYALTAPYAIGEVISRTRNRSGAYAADELVTAIYHRFGVFEPMFTRAGVGAATSGSGDTYFTANFVSPDLREGIGRTSIVVFPMDGQQDVRRNFFSDQEVPDPVPSKNEVGYPVSVHADIAYIPPGATSARLLVLDVNTFTIRARGGSPLPVQPLWRSVDELTPRSAAAIVPLDVLQPSTTYDVEFAGTLSERIPSTGETLNPVPVSRSWSFTTGP